MAHYRGADRGARGLERPPSLQRGAGAEPIPEPAVLASSNRAPRKVLAEALSETQLRKVPQGTHRALWREINLDLWPSVEPVASTHLRHFHITVSANFRHQNTGHALAQKRFGAEKPFDFPGFRFCDSPVSRPKWSCSPKRNSGQLYPPRPCQWSAHCRAECPHLAFLRPIAALHLGAHEDPPHASICSWRRPSRIVSACNPSAPIQLIMITGNLKFDVNLPAPRLRFSNLCVYALDAEGAGPVLVCSTVEENCKHACCSKPSKTLRSSIRRP